MRSIFCEYLGELIQNKEFDDWWESLPIEIPFFSGKEIKVIFSGYKPEKDKSFLSEAERVLNNFLKKGEVDRYKLTSDVYKDFQEFIDDVGLEYLGEEIQKIKTKEEIWNFVYPTCIYIIRRNRRDRDLYLEITCECDWEPEHGLLLVFRQGKSLTRVSHQDGHLTDADAFDKADSEDLLLSRYEPDIAYERIEKIILENERPKKVWWKKFWS